MRILSFSVRNHRSFRDDFFLDLTRNELRTNLPPEGSTWRDMLFPVAGIFGANASGKTSMIRAFHFLRTAVALSSTRWMESDTMVRDPFRLDPDSTQGLSSYELDFILDIPAGFSELSAGEHRFVYQFTIDRQGVVAENLVVYRTSRPTNIINRLREDKKRRVRLGLRLGQIEVSDRELALSRALHMDKELLTFIGEEMLQTLTVYDVGDKAQEWRLSRIADELASGELKLEDLELLARVADVGISKIFVEEEEIPEPIRELISHLNREASEGEDEETKEVDVEPTRIDITEEMMVRSLRFQHEADEVASEAFSLADESSGTRAWLALAVDVVKTLRNGGLLCVDELDTSLHPYLAALIISLFQSEETNRRGAQLIFTSHDVSLLSPQHELNLERKQIWYVEKERSGASELYSLDDFTDVKPGSNVSKQYLEGRFGAVPRLAPALLGRLLNDTFPDPSDVSTRG
ncbi:AAA family ATPase [Trueperella abortisuis]|nr:ATP-binding protein [Trueperella abortisuis]